ncbi:MAG: hypothetical protein ACR2RF_33120 [Geminicoccaceae bacterium]
MNETRRDAIAKALIEVMQRHPPLTFETEKGPALIPNLEMLDAIIEANDAWLEEKGWKAAPREHPNTGNPLGGLHAAIGVDQDLRVWKRLWDLAPTPEDTDQ